MAHLLYPHLVKLNWQLVLGGVGGVLGLGLLALAIRDTLNPPMGESQGPDPMLPTDSKRPLVLHRERAEGVHSSLIALLDAWEREGSFPILVAPDGGLRIGAIAAASQLRFYLTGLSKAKTLSETPHGRGAALDIYPVGFDSKKGLSKQPEIRAKWLTLIAFAQARGFISGKDWTSFVAPDGTTGDWPHLQMANWTKLPYPPPDYRQGMAVAGVGTTATKAKG